MNVDLWLKKARTKIKALDAELLLLYVLQKDDRSFLAAHPEKKISSDDVFLLDQLVELRQQGMPIAYILGEKEFYGRKFIVNQHVLIPRPDSEVIIEIAKKIIPAPKKILDVGTGSGILAITLSLEFPQARVTGTDISREALYVASKNAIKLGGRVDFFQSDLLKRLPKAEKFDLIVANLPYVDIGWPWRSKDLAWEPGLALYAGDGGMELLKDFLVQAKGRSKYLILECDQCQHKPIVKYAKSIGYKHDGTRGLQLVFRNMSIEETELKIKERAKSRSKRATLEKKKN